MRVIIAGGGTGGHIYPAITIAKKLQQIKKCELLFVGTKQGLEADIIPKEGYEIAYIDVKGFERKLSWNNVRNVVLAAKSIWESNAIIKKFKPDLVIGTGGYVCGPLLLAASVKKIPTIIQEQNVIPGITNKVLGLFVDKIAVGYQETKRYFRYTGKVIYTGNPIRDEVILASRQTGIAKFNLEPSKRTILISGGSRGARSINNAMIEVHKYYAGDDKVQLLHVTGQNEYNNVIGKLKQQGIDVTTAGNITIKPYLYDMPLALAAADLAVFRAGAIGLAELTARGVPAILVPYPYAAENHQEYNAAVIERHGAGILIKDSELNGTRLIAAIDNLINNPERLDAMAAASKKLGRPQATEAIVKEALKMVDV